MYRYCCSQKYSLCLCSVCTVDLLLPHSLVLQVTHIQLHVLTSYPGSRRGEPGAICTNTLTHINLLCYTHTHTIIQLQKQLVDDRIESVVLRVDEFKKQLETMNENLTSSSEKMQELHEKMRMLKELFKRIDQVEV